MSPTDTISPTQSRNRSVVAAEALAAVEAHEVGIVDMIRHAAAVADISIVSLRGNITVLQGSGGNIAVLPGPDGKLLIDAGIAVSQKKIAAALDSISSDPIRHLVNTHWHFDHTDGNNWLHDAGATIIAQENTREHLSASHRVDGWKFTFPAAPQGALPAITFQQDLTLNLNGVTILLDYYQPAHTDSDIAVTFPDADVVHVADTWWNGVYPFIDYSSGGNIDGMIDATKQNLSRVSDETIIIPGHGPIGVKADLKEFHEMLVAIRENVSALKKKGLSLEDAIVAKPTTDFDAKWGQFVITPDMFTTLVYAGV